MCDLDELYSFVTELVKECGILVKNAYSEKKNITLKSSAADLVTETDQKVEEIIISNLKKKYPDHRFIGEESVAAGDKCILTDSPTWIIDPIDGTTNFVHTFPFCAICVGLYVNKTAEIGIVYNPVLEQFYSARKGQGAFCNGKQIQVSGQKDIGQSLICSEFGSGRKPSWIDSKLKTMHNIINVCHGIRSLGSCALAMCMVAAGSADCYYEFGVHAWDYAASALIVNEAGGFVSDPQGGALDLMAQRVICASSEELLKEVIKHIEPVPEQRRDDED